MSSSTFQCSPALHRRDGETCLPNSALDKLRRVWNRTHPRNKITVSSTRKNGKITGSGRVLWSKLRKAMVNHYKCDTEYCLVKKLPGLNTKEKSTMLSYFRPEKPTNWDSKPTTWLDSYNIEDVMAQYEQADETFEFIGPVPIDFDKKANIWGKCIVDELCKLDLTQVVKKGTQKIGIIFNLDPHDEPGSHWVCAYVDIPKKTAYYFDSYGTPPEDEIVRFLERCKDQGCDKIYYNDIRHQRKGSECGMYCLIVIICLLRGKPFEKICHNIMSDDMVNAFRDVLYAEENPRKEAIDTALSKLCI
jgi:hypothetical protein